MIRKCLGICALVMGLYVLPVKSEGMYWNSFKNTAKILDVDMRNTPKGAVLEAVLDYDGAGKMRASTNLEGRNNFYTLEKITEAYNLIKNELCDKDDDVIELYGIYHYEQENDKVKFLIYGVKVNEKEICLK